MVLTKDHILFLSKRFYCFISLVIRLQILEHSSQLTGTGLLCFSADAALPYQEHCILTVWSISVRLKVQITHVHPPASQPTQGPRTTDRQL